MAKRFVLVREVPNKVYSLLNGRIIFERRKDTWYLRDTHGEVPDMSDAKVHYLKRQAIKILRNNESKALREKRIKQGVRTPQEETNFQILEKGKLRIGFIGTQDIMTPAQKSALKPWIKKSVLIHIGNNAGSDRQCYLLAKLRKKRRRAKGKKYGIFIRPYQKTLLKYREADKVYKPQNGYKQLIKVSNFIIFAPNKDWEWEGDVWPAVNMARKKRPIVIVYPNGTIRTENF